ncbi:two-component system, chemotaxis family, CheB/CheR fusion protein [Dyadobacter sp. SG02]|uniref:CheR family methyltransferase n=1 Tax=Dyadobacter sp. SG02 TaxID=1855291 RepID=UPI0008C6415E|nr:chemotaxis protein CheB [Dyadobacter sp. SG02]SEJ35727.1 two-component system, chemotaxis family, CheB/CheR fusion protein [Dyadobacter sp. SG02]
MDPIEPHHIVAIGASAGGLDELVAFFENTPLDGVAYIVVQHLSADHESRLAEILSCSSKLEMVEAKDAVRIAANFVYIIPSDKFMTIENGRLYLSKKDNIRGPHLTINTFFNSLALDRGPKAIGVILSGMGADGSEGVKAIKKAGGMIIARNPKTTEFSSMPHNAVATGMVDFIVEPEAMPRVIEDYVMREIELLAGAITDGDNVAGFIALINQQLPLDFSDYKQATILRRIKRRAAYNNFENLKNYLEFAKRSPKEIDTLAKDFLISVTAFFRDRQAFDYLETRVFPAMIKTLEPGQEIRIWVAGCASGEEAYSMAIILSELLGSKAEEHKVKIFATDIDAAALAHAGKGIYTKAVVATIPKVRLEKYFVPEGDGYKVTAELRRMVIFSRHDLVKNPPYCNMNLISCRNLLIYMTPVLQQKIYQMLLFGLKPQGFLFLGSSENPLPIIRGLEVVSKKFKIYKKLDANPFVNFESFTVPEYIYLKPASLRPAQIETVKTPDRTLDGAINETIYSEDQRLVVCIDENNRVLKSYGPTGRFLIQQHFTNDLTELLPGPLSVAFKTACNKVKETQHRAVVTGILIEQGQHQVNVSLSVSPMILKGRPNGFLVVQFSEQDQSGPLAQGAMVFDERLYLDDYTSSLEQENKELKEELATANEKLFSLNENMQSFNEELLSANEEMQSTNEEMQSINEELHTINADYQQKNKELLELNDDLNNYFKSNINGQLFVSSDLRLMRFSPGTVRHINLLESDIGRSITNISTNFRFETLSEDINKVLKDGLPITREVQANDGKWYQVMTMPYVRKLGNKRTGAIITFNDITELKNTQQELDKKNEILTRINADLDNFVHMASHDLLEPLHSIEASIELMDDMPTGNPDFKPFMGIVSDSVKNFRQLVKQISAVARIEDEALSAETVDLNEIVDNVLWSLADKIKQTGAGIKIDLKGGHIHFSKKNLRSILFNLVSNAIKYRSAQPPAITIQTWAGSEFTILAVKDNGRGISQSDIKKIFGKYQRLLLDNDGQGIGLYLAKKIIEAAGGSIQVESTVGVGSEFLIYFPKHLADNVDN